MKNLKEKQLLVNLAKTLGQKADDEIINELREFDRIKKQAKASVSKDPMSYILEAAQKLKEEPKKDTEFPLPPSLDELEEMLKDVPELKPEEREEKVQTEEKPQESLIEKSVKFISEAPKESFQQPDPPKTNAELISIVNKLKYLEQWVSKISVAGPGGGEVNQAFMEFPTRTITENSYTLTPRDYYVGVYYEGAVTLTLPPRQKKGKVFIVKDEFGEASRGTNRYITILPSEGDLIDGRDRAILAFDYGSLTFVFKNGMWRVI